MINNFCNFKAAYQLDHSHPEHEVISDAIANDDYDRKTTWRVTITEIMEEVRLPLEWEYRNSEINGANGFVMIFDVHRFPTPFDTKLIHDAMIEAGRKWKGVDEQREKVAFAED